MIIESRKNKKQHEITKEQWEELRKDGRHRKYRVISEFAATSKGRIHIPDIVKEIKESQKKEVVVEKEEPTMSELRKQLKEKGIKPPARATKETLIKLNND